MSRCLASGNFAEPNGVSWVKERLVCPRHREPLTARGTRLSCARGDDFPIVDGVPVLLQDDVEQTAWWTQRSIDEAARWNGQTSDAGDGIHPHVQRIIASTGGYLYASMIGRVERYPIPELRLPPSDGATFLDVGCNWGRWSIAAARKGYRVVGVDPALEGVLAARDVARQLGVSASFVCADARYLPFADGTFSTVFSYSVLQHFSKDHARAALVEAARVMTPGGTCLVQMPNFLGIRCLYHQARRGFRAPKEFDVRYWSLPELRRTFESSVGPAALSVDGFFGLNIQATDLDLLTPRHRAVVHASEWLRRRSERHSWMKYLADSIYVRAHKPS
jgi:SAM-dependent methyltransferase